MPKLKQTYAQKDRERMRTNLIVAQSVAGMNSKEMGEVINRSHATWENRLKNPDSLRWDDIRTLCAKLNIDIATFCAGELYQK